MLIPSLLNPGAASGTVPPNPGMASDPASLPRAGTAPSPGTYSVFGLREALAQVRRAWMLNDKLDHEVEVLFGRLARDEARIATALGRDVSDLDVLEVGPGHHCLRSGVLGLRNRVTGVDLDEVAFGFDLPAYLRVARKNGPGRLLKTLARKALGVDRAQRSAWARAAGADELPRPRLVHADVCEGLPFPRASFDLIVSWSVFEHLPDPRRAVQNLIALLRPGGVLYLGIHLFTANNGHHDIRAFTGRGDDLPAWGHLRPDTRHLIHPSSVLNGWRLPQWRALAAELLPGAAEHQQRYGEDALRARLHDEPGLRAALADYSEEELLTVDLFLLWRAPG